MHGILPEMVRSCRGTMIDYTLDMFRTVWMEQRVPQEWRDALLVSISKKVTLHSVIIGKDQPAGCDGEDSSFTKVIQMRLQKVAEEVLPDSQCGFQAGKGCTDMIFCARQLMEKAREHNTTLYLMFIDLCTAYDSIPREALWQVLKKYGIPPILVNTIRSLHDGMKTEVMVGCHYLRD